MNGEDSSGAQGGGGARPVGPLMPRAGGRGARSAPAGLRTASAPPGCSPRVDVAKELGVSAGLGHRDHLGTDRARADRAKWPRRGPRSRARAARRWRWACGPTPGRSPASSCRTTRHTAVILDFAGQRAGRSLAGPRATQARTGRNRRYRGRTARPRAAATAGLMPADLAAVGVGLPGVVDSDSGMVLWSPILTERAGRPRPGAGPRGWACRCHRQRRQHADPGRTVVRRRPRRWSDFAVVTIEHGRRHGAGLDHRLYRGAPRHGDGARPYQGAARRRALPLRPARLSRGLCRRLRAGARGGDRARTASAQPARPERACWRALRPGQGRQRGGALDLSAGPGAIWRWGWPMSSSSSTRN